MIFLPKFDPATQHYDITKSYDWNYRNAPALPENFVLEPSTASWQLAGKTVNSPIAIAAGPLLNGRWVLHYAAQGFDVLTYKTVRTKAWPCYANPNLVPVNQVGEQNYQASSTMNGSWAVSFGMPSSSPDLWRFDVEETRRLLPKQKMLSVSVVATPEAGWSVDQVAEDYAKCASWAKDSGADFIELNFSCPNVSTQCSQLYLDPDASRIVTDTVRDRIGSSPLLIKIGQVPPTLTESLVDAFQSADAVVMINCIATKVQNESGNGNLFDGHTRGIAGQAIHTAVREQVANFARAIQEQASNLEVIAVGGIRTEEDIEACLSLGATGVQVATSAMSGR